MPPNLVLIGFSGTGKSSVGRRLAERLGWQFVDLDAEIAAVAGKSIPTIFAAEGEPAFRTMEATHLRLALAREHRVVATGGGAVLLAENRALMLERGLVICLEAQPRTIYERLKRQRAEDAEGALRPLLAGDDPLTRIASLKAERQALYSSCHATIHTDGLEEETVAEDAHRALARAGLSFSPGEGDGPVSVKTQGGYYHVHVGWGLLDDLGRLVAIRYGPTTAAPRRSSTRLYLVSDSEVFARHGDKAVNSLIEAGFAVRHTQVPAGEATKSLKQAETLYEWLIEEKAERRDVIVALGGGVVGDLAGYVAATYLRGIDYVQVPTSLLAMVDSSVGGKTAVDHTRGKNLIGAFHPPSLVVADVSTLTTLPRRELRSGLAEVVKHAMIADEELFNTLEQSAHSLSDVSPESLVPVVRRNVWLKARVVTQDEREGSQRVILNYGHTVGHAVEAVTAYGLNHGEAVAIGMVAAAELAVRLGWLPAAEAARQERLLRLLGLATQLPANLGVTTDAVLAAMARDKKMEYGSLRWILPERIGRVRVARNLPLETVRQSLEAVLHE